MPKNLMQSVKKLAKKFISVFLAMSIALQIAVSAYAEAGVDLSDVFSSDSDLLPPEEYSEEEYTEEPKVHLSFAL